MQQPRVRLCSLARPRVRFEALLILLSCAVLPVFARAQSGDGRTVTLVEVLQRARENPPAILAALATLQRIQAQEQYARGAYIPRFNVEAGTGVSYNNSPFAPLKYTRDYKAAQVARQRALDMGTPESMLPPQAASLPARVDSTSQNSYGRATLDIPVVDLGRRYAVKSASLASSAQREAYSEAQRAAEQAAAELYMRAVAAISLVEDARLTEERRTAQYNAINGLVRAGLRPSVDAVRANIEVIAARFALETREIEVAAAGAALAATIGADPTQPLRPAEFDDSILPAPLDPLQASILAIEHRPELRQLEANLSAKKADHQAAIAARLPTLGVSGTGNVSFNDILKGDGYQGYSLTGIGAAYMRWAALDPAIWRRANVTRGAIDEAQRQLETQLLAVRAEVVAAAYTVKRARALLEQSTQILAGAEAARTAQNERYRAGVASLLDLLDAEGVEQNARRQRIEAARDHRMARVTLLGLCGVLDQLTQKR
ncbi:MAG: efflux pump, family, outer membrane protein [Myxococcaceae bacterium]|nr:efflux pump, family, outer membrane protein [Myxococcaceae bacterium]